MEPKLPRGETYTPPTPERSAVPVPPERGFDAPDRLAPANMERTGETLSQGAAAGVFTGGPIALPTLPTPVPVATDESTVAADDNPVAAADDDLIEKEWVDRAKKIIAETKDDPHNREIAIGKLQSDYLKKRYGKELGRST